MKPKTTEMKFSKIQNLFYCHTKTTGNQTNTPHDIYYHSTKFCYIISLVGNVTYQFSAVSIGTFPQY